MDAARTGNRPATSLPLALFVALVLAGCGGGGSGDDGDGGGPSAATLAQLQDSVFTPRCTGCHDGSQPANGPLPGSMNLTAGNSHTSLVGVPSRQQNTVLRIAPGDPAASYLMRKIEGAPGINGQRMPLGGPPLDGETIARIASWIVAGAANN